MTTRFRIMYQFAASATSGQRLGLDGPYAVLDLDAHGVADGEVVVFGTFPTREAAVMACLALNGVTATE